jgi:hypothetical protein
MRVHDQAGVEGWLGSLSRLVPVPEAHARPTVPEARARATLGCSESAWRILREHGMPAYESPTGPVYDPNDVFNLALHSGSGTSMVERALCSTLRFLSEGPQIWDRKRSWDVQLTAVCGAEPASDGPWTIWLPVHTMAARCPCPPVGALRAEGPALSLSAQVRTEGYFRPVRSARVIEIFSHLLGAGLHYAKFPASMTTEPVERLERGVVDCVSGSVVLADRLRAAGVAAEIRTGWLLGGLTSQHSWVEFKDADGQNKTLDLAFAALARTLFPASTGFMGSRTDRLVATGLRTVGNPVHHACTGDDMIAVSSSVAR